MSNVKCQKRRKKNNVGYLRDSMPLASPCVDGTGTLESPYSFIFTRKVRIECQIEEINPLRLYNIDLAKWDYVSKVFNSGTKQPLLSKSPTCPNKTPRGVAVNMALVRGINSIGLIRHEISEAITIAPNRSQTYLTGRIKSL
jgi:hypothetical protein